MFQVVVYEGRKCCQLSPIKRRGDRKAKGEEERKKRSEETEGEERR